MNCVTLGLDVFEQARKGLWRVALGDQKILLVVRIKVLQSFAPRIHDERGLKCRYDSCSSALTNL